MAEFWNKMNFCCEADKRELRIKRFNASSSGKIRLDLICPLCKKEYSHNTDGATLIVEATKAGGLELTNIQFTKEDIAELHELRIKL